MRLGTGGWGLVALLAAYSRIRFLVLKIASLILIYDISSSLLLLCFAKQKCRAAHRKEDHGKAILCPDRL
jgi:hypothetical protein